MVQFANFALLFNLLTKLAQVTFSSGDSSHVPQAFDTCAVGNGIINEIVNEIVRQALDDVLMILVPTTHLL